MIVKRRGLLYAESHLYRSSLSAGFLKKKEWTTAIVVEKYQRFSTQFPATYFVAQASINRKAIWFGRYLGGMGGVTARSRQDSVGYKAVALAMQATVRQPDLACRCFLAV